jgi:MFS family permease
MGSAAFFVLGIVLVLLGVHQADLTRDLALDLSAFGLLGALLSLGFGAGLAAAGPLIDRLPRRPLFAAACALAGGALLTVDRDAGHARLAVHLVLLGLGGGVYVTLFNAAVLDRYETRAAPSLAVMHAATTAGATSGPWLIALAGSAMGRGWLTTFRALGALYLGLAVIGSFVRLPRGRSGSGSDSGSDSDSDSGSGAGAGGGADSDSDSVPRRAALLSLQLLALCAVAFSYVGVETGITLFAVPWAESQGQTAAQGRAAISAFWFGLMSGRFLLVARKPTPARAWLVACGVIGASIIVAAVSAAWSPVVALAAVGLALGPVYPMMIALTGKHFPGAGTALGLVAASGAGGGFALPWISGAVGDASGAEYAVALLGAGALLIALAPLALRPAHGGP